MLVAGATALFSGLGFTLTIQFAGLFPAADFRADPVRVLQAIVLGVSFLGAGTIFRRGSGRIAGLTMVATIVLAAAVGLACTLERYATAVTVTALALEIPRVTKTFETLRRRKQ